MPTKIYLIAALLSTFLPLPSNAQEMIRIDGVTVLDHFLGFIAEEVTEYEERRLGTSISYNRDDAILTAYIYNNEIEPFPESITDDVATAHFYQITNEVFESQRHGIYHDVELLYQFPLQDNMGRTDWLCSMFRLRLSTWDTEGHSLSCLAVSGWNFLKLRLSSNALHQEDFEDLALRVTAVFAQSAGL